MRFRPRRLWYTQHSGTQKQTDAKGARALYELKTKETDKSVQEVLDAIEHPGRKQDAAALVAIFASVTGFSPRVWGAKQIGFGRYRYRYASGHEGEMYQTGFAPSRTGITLYVYMEEETLREKLGRLGKVRSGKSCVYISRLSDIDIDVLKEMIREAVRFVTAGGG